MTEFTAGFARVAELLVASRGWPGVDGTMYLARATSHQPVPTTCLCLQGQAQVRKLGRAPETRHCSTGLTLQEFSHPSGRESATGGQQATWGPIQAPPGLWRLKEL